jgi:hypothetical protein
MSSLDDPQRIDTRSQWLSSTLADLDRQQDPLAAPPRAMSPDAPKIDDPLGAAETGKAAAVQSAADEAIAPIQAASALSAPGAGIGPTPTASDLTPAQPAATLSAPVAEHVSSDHVGSAPHDSSATPVPTPEPEPPMAAAATPSVETVAPAAQIVFAEPVAEPVLAATPLSAAQTLLQALDEPFGDVTSPNSGDDAPSSGLLDGFGALFTDDDDDPLEMDLLDQASAQLSDAAAALFGEAHESSDGAADTEAGPLDLDAVFEPLSSSLSSSLDTLVASFTADHSNLTSLLNHDLDPHDLLG